MLINMIFFAITLSIDAFGVGVTYGVRNIQIANRFRIILFIVSFIVTLIATCIGVWLLKIIPGYIPNIFGCIMLTCIGLFGILKDPSNIDIDNSKTIDGKESILLGFVMSVDSFVCGISFSIVNNFSLYFPLLVASFHILLLSFGIYIGKKIKSISHLSPAIWGRISGVLLILLGIIELIQ